MTSTGFVVPLVLSFVLGLVFTPLAIGIAVRWKICEKPNGRTSREIAHIGGAAMIAAILFALITAFLFYIPQSPLNRVFLPVFIASGFIIFLLGIIDDLRSLHYLYKLFFQISVSIFIAACGTGLLNHFGLIEISLPLMFVSVAAVSIWMLVVTTSFNLIDGIDGLASGIALIASAAFILTGYIFDLPIVIALSAAVFGAVLAFLRYNFPPAKIFMGDSGSLFLGLMFGLISLLTLISGREIFLKIVGSVFILGIPLLDTVLAFLRRIIMGRPLFEADHLHLHHIYLYRFGSMRKVDYFLWSISILFALLGVLTMKGNLSAMAAGAVMEFAILAVALREMVNLRIPEEKAEEILGGYGVARSRIVVHKD
ncbi:MAG: undecaprenyl/decaprenyl-phosphate alpha-N-acetylglucosaminyl 1-phosphate transferase [Candidatus Krumholzibacteriota bacterium]|nr:undecaprenyl/decaprenyl-phosphate alpha-N-acetylglucosaminyl 1-phosphate transferase [Candidatus Krumholzibacteriota bacterium]